MFGHGKYDKLVQGQFVLNGHVIAIEFAIADGLDAVAHQFATVVIGQLNLLEARFKRVPCAANCVLL